MFHTKKADYETDIFKARNGGKGGDRALLNPRKFRRRQLDNQSVGKERGQARESPSILQCLNDVQIIIFSSSSASNMAELLFLL